MANVKSEGFSVMTALDAFVGWQAFHLRFSLFQGGGASKAAPGRGTSHEGHRVQVWGSEWEKWKNFTQEKQVMAYHYLQ